MSCALKTQAKGHRFRGRSDTEILPHLYEEEGERFLTRLRGMFVLAIYDIKNRSLLLARDRFGIKPLFYAAAADRLMFASEINALRTLPGIDSRPDPQAISDFASLFYIPAPQTFFAGIRALSPGESMRAKFDGQSVWYSTRVYHNWVIAPDPTMTLADAEERTADLLTSAVRRQLDRRCSFRRLLSCGHCRFSSG